MRLFGWVLLVFFVLVTLSVSGAWLRSMPPTMSLLNRLLAGINVIGIIIWFGCELAFGGGDPMRR